MARLFNGLLVVFALGFSGVTLPIAAQAETRDAAVQRPLLAQAAQASKSEAEKLQKEVVQLIKQGTKEAYQQAEVKLQQALRIYKALGAKQEEASTLNDIGGIYGLLGDKQQALNYYNQALSIYRATKNQSGEAATLNKIGNAYGKLGDREQALTYYNQALSIFQALKDRPNEATVLDNIAEVYSDLGEKKQALTYYNQELSILKAINDKSGEAYTITFIGMIYFNLGDKQQALNYYKQALPIVKALKNKPREADTLTLIAYGYGYLLDPQQALNYHNQALIIYKTVNDKSKEATTLKHIGSIYSAFLDDDKQALTYYNQALPIFKTLKDKSEEATTLSNIGSAYSSLGDNQQALTYLKQALTIYKTVDDKRFEAITLISISNVYSTFGDNQQALNSLNQAWTLFKSLDDKRFEALTLTGIGLVYTNLGDYKQALNYYNQALPIHKAAGNKLGGGANLASIGAVYINLGDYQQALSYLNQALIISKATRTKTGEAATLGMIGRVYLELGDNQQALSYLNQSLSISKAIRNKPGDEITLTNIGRVYANLGDKQQALSFHNQALLISKTVGDKSSEAKILLNIATAQRDQGNLTAALTNIEASIAIIETLRANIVNPDLRTSYFASVQKYYRTYIDLLMQLHKQQPNQGYEARALQASESARARGLLDLLTEAKADIKKGADPKLLDEERTIQLKFNTLEKRRIEFLSNNKPIPASFEQEYNTTNQRYQQNKDQIRISSPRYAALTQPKPLKLAEIQQLLDDNTIILEYSLGQDRSYLWLISKTKLTSYKLPKQADIEQLVKQYRSILTDRNHEAATINLKQLAPQLRQTLLAPIADQLGSKRLVIVADGALQYIPFAALPSAANNQPLLLTNEVVHLPSASSLGILRQQYSNRQTPAKTVAVLADPVFSSDDARLANPQSVNPTSAKSISDRTLDRGAVDNGIGKFYRLINTKTEGEAILHLVTPEQGKLSLNFAANLDNVTNSDLSQYRIVHFATHGLMDSVDPKRSGLVLSLVNDKGEPQNGYLRLQDIFNLNLGADLVVLSACQTGIGKEIQGEGLVGLTRGFMYAGAPRVVVSLWNVDDEATSILMSKFYEGILKKGLSPSVALRQAQQAMMQNPKYQAPYYWSAFVLQGEWK